jgi:hypothetical protein
MSISRRRKPPAWLCAFVLCGTALAQNATVTAQVQVSREGAAKRPKNNANVVLWLTSLDAPPGLISAATTPVPQLPRLLQKDKRFDPHILVIPVGTAVEFPNRDPFFHNVFSLFEGKRFDLGLYEAGTSRVVHFDRAGISYIFCNIHPEMSAVVIALKTPYFGVSDSAGKVSIANVPAGRYALQVFAEGVSADDLKRLNRDVNISGSESSVGVFRVVEDSSPATHQNKYGRDYDAPGSEYPAKQR